MESSDRAKLSGAGSGGLDTVSGTLTRKDQAAKAPVFETSSKQLAQVVQPGCSANRKAKDNVNAAPRLLVEIAPCFKPAEPIKPRPSREVRGWTDVDKLNEDDAQACSAYAPQIMQTLREAEVAKQPSAKYLEQLQPDVNAKMRAILVDWLVEVSEEYKLCADTLYQAINYIDRYLSAQVAQRNQLQLIGVTCMWLAAKYEEIYPPNVADFCYITDNTYAKEQLIQMEEVVLKRLNYELTVPTAKTFLRRLLQVCNPDELLHFLSNYLTELSLLDYSMLVFLPSVVAASGVYLANLMLERHPWDANLQHYSDYAPSDIKLCVTALAAVHQAVSNSQQLPAIREKYGHPRFQQVSRIPPVSLSACIFA